jgi:hypothetical protein
MPRSSVQRGRTGQEGCLIDRQKRDFDTGEPAVTIARIRERLPRTFSLRPRPITAMGSDPCRRGGECYAANASRDCPAGDTRRGRFRIGDRRVGWNRRSRHQIVRRRGFAHLAVEREPGNTVGGRHAGRSAAGEPDSVGDDSRRIAGSRSGRLARVIAGPVRCRGVDGNAEERADRQSAGTFGNVPSPARNHPRRGGQFGDRGRATGFRGKTDGRDGDAGIGGDSVARLRRYGWTGRRAFTEPTRYAILGGSVNPRVIAAKSRDTPFRSLASRFAIQSGGNAR